jgi:hypothetical protein
VHFENIEAMSGMEADANGIFHFMDEHPRLGENFYRIQYRQSGENETQGHSGMASAFFQPSGVLPIQVYPNPTYGNVTVEFVKLSSKPATIQVNDAYGRVVLSNTIPEQTEKKEIDMSQLPTGVYWMWIYSENVREQIVKIVKSE